jgi:hypothetical protein
VRLCVSDGYHLDQVTHRQKAHDPVVLHHCEMTNPILSHEPAGIASGVIDVDLNQGSIHHGPEAGAPCRETGRDHCPHQIGLCHETDHISRLRVTCGERVHQVIVAHRQDQETRQEAKQAGAGSDQVSKSRCSATT